MESDLGYTSRIYFDNVTLMLHNVTLTSQKLCQYNNNFDYSETNAYISEDAHKWNLGFFKYKVSQ